MAGTLAPVVLSDIEFVGATGITNGALRVDADWAGQPNSVDAVQLRTRWIARDNGASTPAPTMVTAGGWAERTTFGTEGDFRYIDTIEQLSSAQMAVDGAISEENEAVTQSFFANKTVWAMSRLEVA